MSLLRKVANNRGFTRLEENQSSESLPDAAGDPNNPTNLAVTTPSRFQSLIKYRTSAKTIAKAAAKATIRGLKYLRPFHLNPGPTWLSDEAWAKWVQDFEDITFEERQEKRREYRESREAFEEEQQELVAAGVYNETAEEYYKERREYYKWALRAISTATDLQHARDCETRL